MKIGKGCICGNGCKGWLITWSRQVCKLSSIPHMGVVLSDTEDEGARVTPWCPRLILEFTLLSMCCVWCSVYQGSVCTNTYMRVDLGQCSLMVKGTATSTPLQLASQKITIKFFAFSTNYIVDNERRSMTSDYLIVLIIAWVTCGFNCLIVKCFYY